VIITVNGREKELPLAVTVAELLHVLELPARGTAVEVNQEIVARARHAEHVLAEGDRLEIVTLVGGG
jgi:sulfur carrier protein